VFLENETTRTTRELAHTESTRGRERETEEEERERAHSLERAIERETETENTLAQANERARQCASNRGLCADRVLRVMDMNFGV
jgi:hypothetical protein